MSGTLYGSTQIRSLISSRTARLGSRADGEQPRLRWAGKRGLLLLAPAGCLEIQDAAVETHTETSTAPAALVNGTPDTGHESVGWIGNCTATLIGKRTALTAAHCAADGAQVFFCIYPCGNIHQCSATCMSGTVWRHPSYDGSFDDDAAVVRLTGDFTALSGIVPRRVGGTPYPGNILELVGYGCTDWNHQDIYGQKRTGLNNISDVSSNLIEYDDESKTYGCPGDSGGPAFFHFSDCEVGVQVGKFSIPILDTDYELTRLDTKVDWIQSTAQDPTAHACGEYVCGDGLCQSPESCSSCSQDCGVCPPVCGDGTCNGTETCSTCPNDCTGCAPVCGDGFCAPQEDCNSCPDDCTRCACRTGEVDCCGDGNCLPRNTCRHVNCGAQ